LRLFEGFEEFEAQKLDFQLLNSPSNSNSSNHLKPSSSGIARCNTSLRPTFFPIFFATKKAARKWRRLFAAGFLF